MVPVRLDRTPRPRPLRGGGEPDEHGVGQGQVPVAPHELRPAPVVRTAEDLLDGPGLLARMGRETARAWSSR
jgi:hypothetical protein